MMKGTIRRLDALATDGVERAEASGPPTAFRIWRAGSNVTDHGPTVFSDRSAALLMAEQATRGNRYSIDVDHLSLDKSAPIPNHAAVGWHSLAVRAGELWAVDVQWSDAVRDGLTKDPPAWKYFSPAYDVDPETGEVVSYLNTALTNNPATHRVTALASRGTTNKEASRMAKAKKMSWGDIKSALDGEDENAKAAAYAAIQAAFPDAPEGDDKKASEDEPAKKDGEDEPEKKDAKASEDEPAKKDGEDEPEKKDAKASVAASVLAAQDARIRELEADADRRRKKDEGEERSRLLASHVMSAELSKTLASKPIDFVREVCAALPAKTPSRSTEHVQATRGAHGGADSPRLPPEESQKLAERMGLRKSASKIGWDPNMKTTRVFPVLAGASASKESA